MNVSRTYYPPSMPFSAMEAFAKSRGLKAVVSVSPMIGQHIPLCVESEEFPGCVKEGTVHVRFVYVTADVCLREDLFADRYQYYYDMINAGLDNTKCPAPIDVHRKLRSDYQA